MLLIVRLYQFICVPKMLERIMNFKPVILSGGREQAPAHEPGDTSEAIYIFSWCR